MSTNINVAGVKFHRGLGCGLLSQELVAQDCWLDALVMIAGETMASFARRR